MSARISQLWLAGQSDERLVTLARSGNDRAFEAIVQRYQRELYAAAHHRDRAGRAEDVVQQTFMSAFTALRSGTEVRHLRGWLHQILRRAAIPAPGGQDGTARASGPAPLAASAHETAELRMRVRTAMAAISELPGRQQQALVESAINGRSRAEVAGVMGLSEGAVRQLLHRARTTLRGAATALMPYPVLRSVAMRAAPTPSGFEIAASAAAQGSAGGLAVRVCGLVAAAAIGAGLAGSSALRHLARRYVHHRPAAVAVVVQAQAYRAPAWQPTVAAPVVRVALPHAATTAPSRAPRPVSVTPVPPSPLPHHVGESQPRSSGGMSGATPEPSGGGTSSSAGTSSTSGANAPSSSPDGGSSNLASGGDVSTPPTGAAADSTTATSSSDGSTTSSTSSDGTAVGSS